MSVVTKNSLHVNLYSYARLIGPFVIFEGQMDRRWKGFGSITVSYSAMIVASACETAQLAALTLTPLGFLSSPLLFTSRHVR